MSEVVEGKEEVNNTQTTSKFVEKSNTMYELQTFVFVNLKRKADLFSGKMFILDSC